MASIPLFTYSDAVDHVLSLLGSQANADTARDARRATQQAYREFPAARRWSYYMTRGRITTVAEYSTGTITYTHATRTLTLASGTWPTWAAYGTVVISSVPYEVASRSSGSALILSVNSNPGANVAAGTTYTIHRDKYPLPADFLAIDQLMANGSSPSWPEYVLPRNWLTSQLNATSGAPNRFCIMGDTNYMGVMSVFFQPHPSDVVPFDFIYHRRPRPLLVEEYKTGTVSVTAASTTVTGSGTAWTSKHVGSTIRLSSTTADYPTGGVGGNPFSVERIIISVESTTSVTVDTAIDDAHTAVKYVISDPIDIEDGAMMVAFLRCIEKQGSIARHMRDKVDFSAMYQQALIGAFEADSRSFAPRVASAGGGYRIVDYTQAADMS